MNKTLVALAANPMSYVLGFAIGGSASIIAGVAILAGLGWSLIASGVFLIAGAGYITRGMRQNV